MSQPQLKLVTETTRTPDVFKFNQRREPRHKVFARVTALAEYREEEEDHGVGQICAFELTDQSSSGLGAWSVEPVEMGAKITVFFPAHGAHPGYNSVGTVVRCNAAKNGYSIGLSLQSQMAAA